MLQKLLNLDFFNRKNEELKILEDENSDNLEIREEPLQPNDNDGHEDLVAIDAVAAKHRPRANVSQRCQQLL